MAGFGRFSAPRRVLHKTVPSEGNTGSAERRGSVSFSVSLPMETTGCTLSVLSDDTGEIRNYAVNISHFQVLLIRLEKIIPYNFTVEKLYV